MPAICQNAHRNNHLATMLHVWHSARSVQPSSWCMDDAVRMDFLFEFSAEGCGHRMCRDCAQASVSADLDQEVGLPKTCCHRWIM